MPCPSGFSFFGDMQVGVRDHVDGLDPAGSTGGKISGNIAFSLDDFLRTDIPKRQLLLDDKMTDIAASNVEPYAEEWLQVLGLQASLDCITAC